MHSLYSKLLVTLSCALFSYSLCASEKNIKVLQNISQLSQEASNKKLPLLLVFTTEDCPFCEKVKSEYIRPMIISDEYGDKVIIREVPLNDWDYFSSATEKAIPANKLSRHFKVPFFPVLLFTNANYCEISERIIGFNTPSLYGGRIDQGIEESLSIINNISKNNSHKNNPRKNNICWK